MLPLESDSLSLSLYLSLLLSRSRSLCAMGHVHWLGGGQRNTGTTQGAQAARIRAQEEMAFLSHFSHSLYLTFHRLPSCCFIAEHANILSGSKQDCSKPQSFRPLTSHLCLCSLDLWSRAQRLSRAGTTSSAFAAATWLRNGRINSRWPQRRRVAMLTPRQMKRW